MIEINPYYFEARFLFTDWPKEKAIEELNNWAKSKNLIIDYIEWHTHDNSEYYPGLRADVKLKSK